MLVFLLTLLLLFSAAVPAIVTPAQDGDESEIIRRSTSFTTGSQSVLSPLSHVTRTVTTSGGSGPIVFPQGQTQTFTRTVMSGQPGTVTAYSSGGQHANKLLSSGFGTGLSTGGGQQTVTYTVRNSTSSGGWNGIDYNQLLAQGKIQNGQSYFFNSSSAGFPDLSQLGSDGQTVVRTMYRNLTSGGFQNIPGLEGIGGLSGSSQNTLRRVFVTNYTSSGSIPGESQQFSYSSGGPTTIRNITRIIRTKKITLNDKGEPIEVDDDSNGFGFGNFTSTGGHTGSQQFSYSSGGLRFPPPTNPVITRNITRIVRTKKIILNSNGEPIEVDDNDANNFNFGNISFGSGGGGQQQYSVSSGVQSLPSASSVTVRNVTRIVRTKKIIQNSQGQQIEVDGDDDGFNFGNFTSSSSFSGQGQSTYSSGGLRFPPPKNPLIIRNITRVVRTKKIIRNSQGQQVEVDDGDEDGSNFGNYTSAGGYSEQSLQFPSSSNPSFTSHNTTRIIRRKKIVINSKGEQVEVDDEDGSIGSGSFVQQQSSFSTGLRFPPPANPTFSRNITRIIRRKKIIVNSKGEPEEVDDENGDVENDFNFGNYSFGSGTSGQQQYSYSSGGLRFPPPANPTFSRNITRIIRRKKIIVNSKGVPEEIDDDSEDAFGSDSSVQQQSSFSSGGLRFPPPANPTFSRNITRTIRRKKIIVNSNGQPEEMDDENGDNENDFIFGNYSFGSGTSGQQQYSHSSGGLRFPPPGNPTFRRNSTRIIRRKKVIVNSKGQPEEVDDDNEIESDLNFENITFDSGSFGQQQTSGGLRFPPPSNPVFTRNITRIIRRKKVIINKTGEPVEVDDVDGSNDDFNLRNFTFGNGESGQQQYSYSSQGLNFHPHANSSFRRNVTRTIRRKKVTINSKGEPVEMDDDEDNDYNTGNFTFGSGTSGQQQYSFSSGGLKFPPPDNPKFKGNTTRIIRRKKIIINSKGEPTEVDDDDSEDAFGSGSSVQQQFSFSSGGLQFPPPANPTFSRNFTRIIRRKKIIVNSRGEPEEVDDASEDTLGSGSSVQQQSSFSSGGLRFPPPANPTFSRNITRIIRRKKIIVNSKGVPEEIDDESGDNEYGFNFGNYSFGSGDSGQQQSQYSYSSGGLRFPPPANPTYSRNITRIIRRKKIIVNSKGVPEEVDDDSEDTLGSDSSVQQQSSFSSGGLRFPPPANPTFSRNITQIIRRKKIIVNSKGQPEEVDDENGAYENDFNFGNYSFGSGTSGQQQSQYSYSSGGLRFPPPGNPTFSRNITRIIRRKKVIVNSKGQPEEVDDDTENENDFNFANNVTFGGGSSVHQSSFVGGGLRFPPPRNPTFTRNVTRIIRRKKIIVNSNGEPTEVDDDEDENDANIGNGAFGQQHSFSSRNFSYQSSGNPANRNITRIIRRKKVTINNKGEQVEVDDDDDNDTAFTFGNKTFTSGATTGQQYSYSQGVLRSNPVFTRNITRIARRKKIIVNSRGEPVEVEDNEDNEDFNSGNHQFGNGAFGQQQYSHSSNPAFGRNRTRIIRRKKVIVNSKGEPTEVDEDDYDTSGSESSLQQQSSFSSGGLRFPPPVNPTFRNITRIIRRKKIITNSNGEPVEIDDTDGDDSDFNFATQQFGGGYSEQQQSSFSSGGLRFPPPSNPTFTRNITRIIRRKKVITNSKGEPIEVDDDEGYESNPRNYTFGDGSTGQRQFSYSSGNPQFTTRNITRIIRRKKVIINNKGEPIEVDDEDDNDEDLNYGTGFANGDSVQQQSSFSSGLRFPPPPNPTFIRNITRIIRRKKIIVNSKGQPEEVDDETGDNENDLNFGNYSFGNGNSGQQQSQYSYSSGGLRFPPPANPTFSRNITRIIRRKKIIVNSKGVPEEIDDDSEYTLGSGSSVQQQSSFSSGGLRFPPPLNPTFSRNITRIIRRKKIIVNSKGQPEEIDDENGDNQNDFNFGNYSFGSGDSGQQQSQYSYSSGGLRFPPPGNPTFSRNITRIIRRKKVIVNSKGEQVEVDDDSDLNGGNYSIGGGGAGQQHYAYFSGGLRFPPPQNSLITRNVTRIVRRKKIILNSKGEQVEVDDDEGGSNGFENNIRHHGISEHRNSYSSAGGGKRRRNRRPGNSRRIRNTTTRITKTRRIVKGINGENITVDGDSGEFSDESHVNTNSTYSWQINNQNQGSETNWSGQTGVNIAETEQDDYYDSSLEGTGITNSKQPNTDLAFSKGSTNSDRPPIKRGTETTIHSKNEGSGYKGSEDFAAQVTTVPSKGAKRPRGSKGVKPGNFPGDRDESEEPDEYDVLGNGVTVNYNPSTSKTFDTKGGGTKGVLFPFLPPDVSLTTTTSTTVSTTTTQETTTSTTMEPTTRFSEFDSDFGIRPAEGDDSGEGPLVSDRTTQDPDVEMFDVDEFGADRNVGDKQKMCENSLPIALLILMWAALAAVGIASLLGAYYLLKKYGLCKCCCRRNNKDPIYTIDKDPLMKGPRNSPEFSQDTDHYAQNLLLQQDDNKFPSGFAAAAKFESTNGRVSYPIEDTSGWSSSKNQEISNEEIGSCKNYQNPNTAAALLSSTYGGSQMNTGSSQRQSIESPRVVKTFRKLETQQSSPTPREDINDGSDASRTFHSWGNESLNDKNIPINEKLTKLIIPPAKAKRLSGSSIASFQTEDGMLTPGMRQSSNTVTRITIEKHVIPHGDQQSSLGSENVIAGSSRNSPNINLSRSSSFSTGILPGQSMTTKVVTTIIKQASGSSIDNSEFGQQDHKSEMKRITFEGDHGMSEDRLGKSEDYGDSSFGNRSTRSITYLESPIATQSDSKEYSSYQGSPKFGSKSFTYGNEGHLSRSSPANVESRENFRTMKTASMGKNFLVDQSSTNVPDTMSQSQSGSSTSTKTLHDGTVGTRTTTTRKFITTNTSEQNVPEDIQIMEEMDDFLKYIDED